MLDSPCLCLRPGAHSLWLKLEKQDCTTRQRACSLANPRNGSLHPPRSSKSLLHRTFDRAFEYIKLNNVLTSCQKKSLPLIKLESFLTSCQKLTKNICLFELVKSLYWCKRCFGWDKRSKFQDLSLGFVKLLSPSLKLPAD